MATQVQLRRGTSAQNDAFTGATGELTYDTTNKRVRVHDGGTAGGFEIKTEDGSGNTIFADNEKAIFGASSDLQIYHDGLNSYVKDAGTGSIVLEGQDLYLNSTVGTYLRGVEGGAVTIFHNDSTRFTTTSTGIQVTGNIANASGDLTLDVAGDISLDADGAQIRLKDGGTQFGLFGNESSDFLIQSSVQDKDIIFQGNDNGVGVTALTLDMSAGGTAIFNHDIKLLSSEPIIDSAGNIRLDAENSSIIFQDTGTAYGKIFKSSDNFVIKSEINDGDIVFQGFDGGSTITALTFDMSDAGSAYFNTRVAVGIGSSSTPSLTFSGDLNTGIYRPSSDNLGFAIGGVARAFMSASQFNMTGNGVFSGSITKGSGSFKIDHPLESKKDTHHLVHSFVEAPQADNIYRGKVDLVDGSATVNLDTASGMTEGTFILLNTNTQCFTSNETGWTAVKGSVSNNILTITAEVSCTDSISWLVVGERHDQHMIDTEWTDDNGKVIVEPTKT